MIIRQVNETIAKIRELRDSKNAVILAHNYELGEIQDIADYNGDSLGLSFEAKATSAETIVFCGVKFMAETAKILSPEKKVLLPAIDAGCQMADMIDANTVRNLKRDRPNAIVACYVNSTAEVKAESDLCVTSANAVSIISKIEEDREIIFVPDANLGAHVARETGREIILHPGYCPIHMRITPEDIKYQKQRFPDAIVLVHPESQLEVIDLADVALSTGGMCKFVKDSNEQKFIIATELGMIYRLRKDNPEKTFIPVSEQTVCPDMKKINLENLLSSLENDQYEITVPEEIRLKALRPIERMLEMSK